MHADLGKTSPEARFHEIPGRGVDLLTGGVQYVVDDRRSCDLSSAAGWDALQANDYDLVARVVSGPL